jgi:hypothetical protein
VIVKLFQFPVMAFSPVGWTKEADSIHEFVDASPDDDLSGWQGLVIYDSGSSFTQGTDNSVPVTIRFRFLTFLHA